MMKLLSTLVIALPVLAGCASAPPPTAKMASAESSVRTARELGAEGVPTAKLQLKLADEEIAKAKALVKEDENELADTMLQRAMVDAELALALSRKQSAQALAEQVIKDEQDLKAAPAPATAP